MVCITCGGATRHGAQKYCSTICRPTKPCEACAKPNLMRAQQRFCSRKCVPRGRRVPYATFTCRWCFEDFETRAKPVRKFCSRLCCNKAVSRYKRPGRAGKGPSRKGKLPGRLEWNLGGNGQWKGRAVEPAAEGQRQRASYVRTMDRLERLGVRVRS